MNETIKTGNDLVKIENKDGKLMVSSRVVADRFEKQHKDVIRDIEKVSSQTSAENCANLFIESTYLDSYKREQKQYLLTRDGFSLLAMGFTGAKALEWKLEFIEAFNKMEEELRKRNQPQGKELLALAVLEAQRTIEAQTALLEEQKPKVIFADAVSASHTSILIGELAKILRQNGVKTGQNRLFEWLRKNGYLVRRKGTDYNMPTQRSMDLGLFEIKETSIVRSDDSITINKTVKVTGKGQIYFINKLGAQENALVI